MPPTDRIRSMETPRALRSVRAGVSLGDVARATGLHVTSVSRIFNGKRKPSLNALRKISDYLGCSMDELSAALSEAEATIPRAA